MPTASYIAYELGLISAFRQNPTVTAQIPSFPQILVQATGWRRNAQGKIDRTYALYCFYENTSFEALRNNSLDS